MTGVLNSYVLGESGGCRIGVFICHQAGIHHGVAQLSNDNLKKSSRGNGESMMRARPSPGTSVGAAAGGRGFAG
jgi:hypothetical protein